MVFIDGIKYACERCIRGHRVTTCNHTDQKLIKINPKGRPLTQCKHCKEARKNSNHHSLCTCGKQKKNSRKKKEEKPSCRCEDSFKCVCKPRPTKTHQQSALSTPPVVPTTTLDPSPVGMCYVKAPFLENPLLPPFSSDWDLNLLTGASSDALLWATTLGLQHDESVALLLNHLVAETYGNNVFSARGVPKKVGEVNVPLEECLMPSEQEEKKIETIIEKPQDSAYQPSFDAVGHGLLDLLQQQDSTDSFGFLNDIGFAEEEQKPVKTTLTRQNSSASSNIHHNGHHGHHHYFLPTDPYPTRKSATSPITRPKLGLNHSNESLNSFVNQLHPQPSILLKSVVNTSDNKNGAGFFSLSLFLTLRLTPAPYMVMKADPTKFMGAPPKATVNPLAGGEMSGFGGLFDEDDKSLRSTNSYDPLFFDFAR